MEGSRKERRRCSRKEIELQKLFIWDNYKEGWNFLSNTFFCFCMRRKMDGKKTNIVEIYRYQLIFKNIYIYIHRQGLCNLEIFDGNSHGSPEQRQKER